MKPILFYVESISLCHVARLITIAQTVRAAGTPVVFACGENHRPLVEEKGFKAVVVPVLPPQTVYGRLRQFQPTYRYEELRDYYQADRRVVEEIDPSLILFDLRLTIPLVGEKLGIPTASVVNGIYSRYFRETMSAPFFVVNRTHLPQGLLTWLLGTRAGQALAARLERPFSAPLDRLYEEEGGTPQGRFAWYMSAGDLTLAADVPELVPLQNAPPTTVHIGPALWDPPKALRGDAPPIVIPKDRPAVYLSLGSSVFPEHLVGPCVRQLLEAGYRVLLQVGHNQIGDLPSHEHLAVHKFVANGEVLPQVDLLISHGGVTTSYEALAAGTPVLGLPSFTDQQWNLDRVIAAGAGLMLDPTRVTPARLLERVRAVVDQPRFAQRARELGEKVKAFPTDPALRRTLAPWLAGVGSGGLMGNARADDPPSGQGVSEPEVGQRFR